MNQEQRVFQEKPWTCHSAHTGAALLLFLIILILGMSSLLLSQFNDRTALILEEQAQTTKTLLQAKEALLGYAASYYETHLGEYGFLPCPDEAVKNLANDNEEGQEDGNCPGRNQSRLGRFPWKTLGIPPLRDGTGECLWYAVSGPYKNGSTIKTEILNEDTNGLFEVSTDPTQALGSISPKDRAVAVIIAPGRILAGQQRGTETGAELCGGNYTSSNYLESFSLSSLGISQFISAQGGNSNSLVNDRIIAITRQELWQFIRKRTDFLNNMKCLTDIAAICLGNYGQDIVEAHYLPWPAPIDLQDYSEKCPPPPTPNYVWNYKDECTYSDYHDPGISSPNAVLGRLPNEVGDSNATNSVTKNNIITECNFTRLSAVNPPLQFTRCPDLQAITTCNRDAYAKCLIKLATNPGDTCKDDAGVLGCENNNSVDNFLKLWQNWKDHLFYAAAKIHLPNIVESTYVSCHRGEQAADRRCCLPNEVSGGTCTAKTLPSCGNTTCFCEKICVKNPEIDPATESCPAVVLFAGEWMGLQTEPIQFPGELVKLQTRNAPLFLSLPPLLLPPIEEIDTKNRVWSYLNNQNWGETTFTIIKKDANFQEPPTSLDNEDTNDIISSCVRW